MSDENGMLGQENHGGSSPAVSLVIINWNKSALTLDCLRSIAEHTRSVPQEVIVVDNGSAADEIEILKQGCADKPVNLIWLRHNRSFGEANNIGVEAASAKYVLLVNNDVTFTQSHLETSCAPCKAAFEPEQ